MQWLMSGAGNLGEWEAGWWPPSPLCLWHVSAERWSAAPRWGPPVWPRPLLRLLTPLAQPALISISISTSWMQKLWPKINNTTQGKSRAQRRRMERQREMERRARKRMWSWGLFHPFCSSKSAPYFIPLSLSPGSSNEWHYRQCHIQSDTNLFRLQRHSVFPQNQGRFVWGQFGFHKGFKWFLWR